MDSPSRLERLAAWLPGLRLLIAYDRSWWRHDLTAGLVVTLVLIPSAIAYADLAKCSPIAGLYAALSVFRFPFAEAQALGAVCAMTSNFILNNFLTYRDQRLKGFAIVRGLLLFYLVCSVGLFANVGVAFSVYDQQPIWWLAGAAGALMGVVWNYAMSGLFVWRKR